MQVKTERVDDIPLLLEQLKKMKVEKIFDDTFKFHGNWQGLSPGKVTTIWLSHILSQADHRMNQVEEWSGKRQTTLEKCVNEKVRSLDFADDRLSLILQTLSDDKKWSKFEQSLNKHLLRVYDFSKQAIRIDSTTVSGYWSTTEEGIFQLGYSKDKRPDLPQVKVNISALDPLGMPLVTQIVSGNTADDPLYVPAIEEIKQSFNNNGLFYVGDCKMSAINTRAFIDKGQDFYLCPLSSLQFSQKNLDEYLESVEEKDLIDVYRTYSDGETRQIAKGFEKEQSITTSNKEHSWQERRFIICSDELRKAEMKAFDSRLLKAQSSLGQVTSRKRGKKILKSKEEIALKVEDILKKNNSQGLFVYNIDETVKTRTKRAYLDRPPEITEEKEFSLSFSIDKNALEKAKKRLGWRIYVTNHASDALSLQKAVLAYRNEYIVERDFSRLKGRPLSLSPTYLTRQDHVIGLIRLLSIILKLVCLLEFTVRSKLKEQEQEIAGLYAGNPKRSSSRPTTELLLRAFKHMDFSIVELPTQTIAHITPLSELQRYILLLLGLPDSVYERFSGNSSN